MAEQDDSAARPTRRQRRGSTLEPVRFRPLDRNQRARLVFLAERFDAATKEKGKHGGDLKRTGLAVLRALIFHFHNVHNGRCFPSYDAIAEASGVGRSTIGPALERLELAGIVTRTRRAKVARIGGRKRVVQDSNAYVFDLPKPFRMKEMNWYGSAKSSEAKFQAVTTAPIKETAPDLPESLALALARLKIAMEKEESGVPRGGTIGRETAADQGASPLDPGKRNGRFAPPWAARGHT